MMTRQNILGIGLLAVAVAACGEGPTDAEVSETELWRLELEQTDDVGSTSAYPPRGTINLMLELNHTTTPDPACSDAADPNATTFLADARALPSRLQSSATGTAEGTWNCHGFSATVSLNDGTTYELAATEWWDPTAGASLFELFSTEFLIEATPFYGTWSAGARRGSFVFSRDENFAYDPFDSFVDVLVQNHRSEATTIALGKTWTVHDSLFQNGVGEFPNGGVDVTNWADVRPSGTTHLSWPGHDYQRFGDETTYNDPNPVWIDDYEIYIDGVDNIDVRDGEVLAYHHGRDYHCYLAIDHPPQLELILDDDGLECGRGWLPTGQINITPRWVFLRPGESTHADVVFLPGAEESYDLSVRTSEPGVSATLSADLGVEYSLTLEAARSAARGEHGVIVTAVGSESGDATSSALTASVYELGVTIEPDTIRVAENDSATAIVRLEREGLLGVDVRLSADITRSPSAEYNPTRPSVDMRFDPAVGWGDSSVFVVRTGDVVAPGAHSVKVCATIVPDSLPSQDCHAAGVVTLIVESEPLYDLYLDVHANSEFPNFAAAVAVGDAVMLETATWVLGNPVPAVEVHAPLPVGFTLDSVTTTQGSYDATTGIWTVGDMEVATGEIVNSSTLQPDDAKLLRLYATADSAGAFTFAAERTGARDRDVDLSNDADFVTIFVTDAGGEPGSISGTITVNGEPLTDVSVTISGDATGGTSPDSNGHYSFTGLSAGQYTITISGYPSAISFPSDSQDVTLGEGEAATVDFQGTA
ncbi:MAG TPA: carboxypeptidase regulatory-like domain-containing protein [Longimicrobiales bacterium]